MFPRPQTEAGEAEAVALQSLINPHPGPPHLPSQCKHPSASHVVPPTTHNHVAGAALSGDRRALWTHVLAHPSSTVPPASEQIDHEAK